MLEHVTIRNASDALYALRRADLLARQLTILGLDHKGMLLSLVTSDCLSHSKAETLSLRHMAQSNVAGGLVVRRRAPLHFQTEDVALARVAWVVGQLLEISLLDYLITDGYQIRSMAEEGVELDWCWNRCDYAGESPQTEGG